MRKVTELVCVTLLGIACLAPALAQETREQAVAGMRKVDPKEMDPTYTKPAPFAQKLVDEALAKHPEVILIAIHAQPSGHKNVIVASNFGRIGKIGDEDDLLHLLVFLFGRDELDGRARYAAGTMGACPIHLPRTDGMTESPVCSPPSATLMCPVGSSASIAARASSPRRTA